MAASASVSASAGASPMVVGEPAGTRNFQSYRSPPLTNGQSSRPQLPPSQAHTQQPSQIPERQFTPHGKQTYPQSQVPSSRPQSSDLSRPAMKNMSNGHGPQPTGAQPQFQGDNATPLENTVGYAEVAATIRRAEPNVVRQVIRDLWEKCMLGSEFHIAFLLNAGLHQASPKILDAVYRENSAKLRSCAVPSVFENVTPQELDRYTQKVITTASPEFLDRILEHRLESIPARRLLNSLARAERLGYDVEDMVEETGNPRGEHVIPSFTPTASTTGQLMAPNQAGYHPAPRPVQFGVDSPKPGMARIVPHPPPTANPPRRIVFCGDCNRPCASNDALQYHRRKKACSVAYSSRNLGKDVCPFCGCHFGGNGGLAYHMKQDVCGTHVEADTQAIIPMLQRGIDWRQSRGQETATPYRPNGPLMHHRMETPSRNGPSPAFPHQTPAVSQSASALPAGVPWDSEDYQRLSQDTRSRFVEELRIAEAKYGGLIIDAQRMPEPQKSAEISKVKNRWNTKQCNTRKKYGISLRASEKRGVKRIRLDDSSPSTPNQESSSTPRTANPNSEQSPRKRIPVSEMGGGLTGVSATAEWESPLEPQRSQVPSVSQQQQTRLPETVSQRMVSEQTEGKALTPGEEGLQRSMDIDLASGSDSSSTEDDDEGIPA